MGSLVRNWANKPAVLAVQHFAIAVSFSNKTNFGNSLAFFSQILKIVAAGAGIPLNGISSEMTSSKLECPGHCDQTIPGIWCTRLWYSLCVCTWLDVLLVGNSCPLKYEAQSKCV